jgi:hypothetical protein
MIRKKGMSPKIIITAKCLAIPIFFVLTSCASDGSKLRSYSKTRGQKAIVANMGVPRTEYFSNKLGGGLGLIGAAIEAAATKNTSTTQAEEIETALATKDIVADFGSFFKQQLTKCRYDVSQEVRVAPQSREEWWRRDITNWRKSAMPSPEVKKARGVESLAFEIAVVNLVVTSRMNGEILGADVEVKIFDLENSNMIEKIAATNIFVEAIDLKNFSGDKDKKYSELNEATTMALNQLAFSLGKKLCDI